ncbi:SDR family oxidoreductase [Kutzneria sp. CA-103260]|uniref:SDR family oxidoreductase n=1 Tax=Kutzneria sp. CA-103260 TaxID=2802641 RepID=UPI001BA72740|nr:SDR family oxidoreductase [Kutzneria sp. CA-103260]QUQ63712.1 short-chain dehydrogenase [Kutzneria sp. CA-103260]
MSLRDKSVLVIGRPSGIARAIVDAALAEGARVTVAGRDADKLREAYGETASAETVDVTDDNSIQALAERVGSLDHLVTTASARARGRLQDLDRESLLKSFDTKVIGPVMLAKHFAPRITEGGSFTLFSGVAAFKPAVGYLGVAITNGAADFLTRSLALELAPIRVNALSPGVIDTGIWDALGQDGKRDYFEHFRTHNPARRIGDVEDIAQAAIFAMTNRFLTGVTLRVDGGEPLT